MSYLSAIILAVLIATACYLSYKLGKDAGYVKGYDKGCDDATEIGIKCMDDLTKKFIDFITKHGNN